MGKLYNYLIIIFLFHLKTTNLLALNSWKNPCRFAIVLRVVVGGWVGGPPWTEYQSRTILVVGVYC